MNPEDRLETSPRLKLLFVDADQRVLNSLRAMFRQDHDVVGASHVHEALQALDETPMDVVVADDRLPDTNGLDLLHWVRLRAPEAARILLVGAGEQPYDAATIRRAQLFRVLAKPCAPDVLRATIAQAGRTARVGRASALMRAAASATQPDGAANDAPPEEAEGTRPVLALSDDDSGLHRTLDGAEHTFGGTPRAGDLTSSTGTSALPDVAELPANAESDAAAPAPNGHVHAGEPDVPSTAAPMADGTDEYSRPITTRVWSAHGITVEEDAYDDPTDTERVFASMLEDKGTLPPAADQATPAVKVSAPQSRPDDSVLPATPLADDTDTGSAPVRNGASRRVAGVGNGLGATPATTAAPLVPTEVLVLSDDAITRAELRRSLERAHLVVEAATPDAALNAVCSSCCATALVDGRGRSPRAIERTARTLLSAAPELSILVFAEIAESGALFELPARVPGIVSLLYALPTQEQLLGALAWAHAVACSEAANMDAAPAATPLMLDLPAGSTGELPTAASAAVAATSTGASGLLGGRLRRVSRFLTGAHDD